MDGANSRFILGKEQWLADHLILYKVGRRSATGTAIDAVSLTTGSVGQELSIFDFDLRKKGNMINLGQKAKQYELFSMDEDVNFRSWGKNRLKPRSTGKRTNVLSAYFLPWGPGKTFSGRLGLNADFFFTPTLNGCTFAYRGTGPNPEVAHSNFVDQNTTVDQTAIDNDMAQVFGGTIPQNVLRKNDYKLPIPDGSEIVDYRTMIVGIRNGNNWRFFQQHYSVNSSATAGVYNEGHGLCNAI